MRWLRQRPWRRALVWLAGLAPFFYLSYGLANHLAAQRAEVAAIVFDWERQIPFVAETIFPYWSINAFYGLSIFLCRSRHELDRHGLRLLTAQLVAIACFIALPLRFTFGAPEVEGPAAGLFAALRGFDKPFNQAPSLHIALAVILWDFYRRLLHGALARGVLHVWTLLVCVSVLTTFQHHFIDIPTGALLGVVCVALWPLERRPALLAAARPARDGRRRTLALRYAAGAGAAAALALYAGGWLLWLLWLAVALAVVALHYAFLGERGFAKRRDAGADWSMRWLTAPYRAGAWANSRAWTRGRAAPVEVAPGVWLGRLPGRLDAAAAPWASLVDLTAEIVPPRRWPAVSVPMLDLVVPAPRLLRRAAQAIAAQRATHGSVLVCCALGYSRSAAAVCTWLVASGRAGDAAAAEAIVRAARPQVVLSDAHRRAVDAAAGAGAAAAGDATPDPAAPPGRAGHDTPPGHARA